MNNPIGWTDQTWNPMSGCTPISEGCAHCYARRMAQRLKGRYGYPADEPFRVTLHPDRLDEPLRWRKPRHVFVCSMGDLFHDDVPVEFIAQVFGIMAITCPNAWIVDGRPVPIGEHHVFQILTKRPDRMRDILTSDGFAEFIGSVSGIEPMLPMPHVWLGTTVENQYWADERIPILLDTPAAVRFVSSEPLLGPVDLDALDGGSLCLIDSDWSGERPEDRPPGIDWVIAGGETGPGARPMHADWARSLRDQCAEGRIPFWFKGGLLDGAEWHQRPGVTP